MYRSRCLNVTTLARTLPAQHSLPDLLLSAFLSLFLRFHNLLNPGEYVISLLRSKMSETNPGRGSDLC